MIKIFSDIYRNQWSDTPYSKTDVCMRKPWHKFASFDIMQIM